MEKQTYNGWTNYATWRVNLEIFDGLNPVDYGWAIDDEYTMAQQVREYAEEIIDMTASEGLARDYALAFLSDVDWQSIAEHLICDWADDERDEDEETETEEN